MFPGTGHLIRRFAPPSPQGEGTSPALITCTWISHWAEGEHSALSGVNYQHSTSGPFSVTRT